MLNLKKISLGIFLASLFACSSYKDLLEWKDPLSQNTEKPSSEPQIPDPEHFELIQNEDVSYWMQFYQEKGRRSFRIWLQRGAQYQVAMEKILVEEGLPRSFFYVALVESGFAPRAMSKAKASGPWQFLKKTAQHYGLRCDKRVDERRDPLKSTRAAARYLKDLYAQFGDWHLALAAYNSGPTRIQKAMRDAKTKDFWELKRKGFLKKETGNFVPKIMASALIGSNPQAFGFALAAE